MKTLNPYLHTCHIPAGAGHDPKDCPACRWVEINTTPIFQRPMTNTVKSNLSQEELKLVVQQVLDLRRVSKITGFNTLHEIVAILGKLSGTDLIAVGRLMDLKPQEMRRIPVGKNR